MKSAKQGAFANSATGYGKKTNNTNPSFKHSAKCTNKSDLNTKKEKEPEKPKVNPEEQDNDLNSGFGSYLRSNEGVEMMKLFVFANTIMMILTMAWPHFKQQYIWLMAWLDTFREE